MLRPMLCLSTSQHPLGVVTLPQITDQKTKPLGGQATTGQGHTVGKERADQNPLLSTEPAL